MTLEGQLRAFRKGGIQSLMAFWLGGHREECGTSCASVLRMSAVTERCRPGQASAAAGLHSQRQRFCSSASLNLRIVFFPHRVRLS